MTLTHSNLRPRVTDAAESAGCDICEVPEIFQGDTDSDRSRHFQAGTGRCDLCNCPCFAGKGDQCDNCGHNYADHSGGN